MATRYSLWLNAREAVVDSDGQWLIGGPWVDAEYEDTLAEALEHLDLCCRAVSEGYGDVDVDSINWYPMNQDVWLLEHLLNELEPDHRWYNELHELLFMNTLAGA